MSAPRAVEAQQEYNYSVDAQLGTSDYRLYTMVLTEGAELTVFISSTGGPVDVYLLDAQGTSEFLTAMVSGSSSGVWSYLPDLSMIDTEYFFRTYTIIAPYTYSVAILNNQTVPVMISGTVISQNPEVVAPVDWTIIAIIVGAGAVALLLIIVLVLIPRTYRLQAEVDSNARQPLGEELDTQQMRTGFGGKCPHCGHKNPQGSMFCASCGERVN
ncbi:MAG: hypothetical protein A3K76_00020 [Euryarchaeota archaeon RBG_13_57_23]|nr:MAG: hypothetical protein A3K76_00020 [Euryarchaeota archaeon RBG_13_57_23]